jgi:hypothetical protein
VVCRSADGLREQRARGSSSRSRRTKTALRPRKSYTERRA